MYKRRPFSMIFFHRRKSLIVKLILVVPITWIIVTTLLSLTEKIGLEKEVDEVVVDVPNLVIEQNIVTVGGDKYEGRKPRQSMEEPPRLSILPHIGLDTKPEMELNLGNVHEIHADDRPDLAQLAPPREPEGPGEGGKPVSLVNLTEEQQRLVKEGWEKNAFNQYVSDIISLHRYLPDVRPRGCQEEKYDDDLPPTSVIICFHNEAWSVLLRTVHSVLDRSPPHLIEEVILVDDFSDMPHLGRPLEDYFLHQPKVKVIRARRREGLIRARLMGAAAAKAPILTYLDSHCECAQGWLEPLLQRIANNWTTVVCPVIDVIDDETFEYHFRESGEVNVGGFDWNLQFSWHAMPEREHKRRNHTWDPVWSPTMAGGLFSIDKKFFERLGTYDSGFDIWGGENLELSFKTWMCGGSLEIIPCSHVGHIFRKRSPYKWKTGVNVLRKNSVRLAEVWLDEYKKYYYDRIGNDLGEFGDVTSRLELRKKLQCKSFDWYLKTVYPELYIPGEALGQGENIAYMRRYQAKMITSGADWKFQKNYNKLKTIYQEYAYKDDRCALVIDFRNKFMKIRNLGDGGDTCLDSAAKRDDFHKPIGLWPCHSQGGNQYWMFSKEGEIKRDEACLDYSGGDVILYPCHGAGGNQMWIYDPNLHTIQQTSSRKCMELAPDKQSVLMAPCSGSPRQKWLVQNYDPTKLAKSAS